jgi:hypothetical protein
LSIREGEDFMTGRSPNRFNKREVTRAIKGTEDAGRAVDHVVVDPKTGRITVFGRDKAAAPANDDGQGNPWEALKS